MLRGPSLMAIIILWGLPLLLVGRAVLLAGYPAWLGWAGMVVGAVTILAATALLLEPNLFCRRGGLRPAGLRPRAAVEPGAGCRDVAPSGRGGRVT